MRVIPRSAYRVRFIAALKRAEEMRRRRAVAASAAAAHELSEAEFARLAHETLYGRVERCPGCGGWKDSTRQCVTCTLAAHRRGDRCSS